MLPKLAKRKGVAVAALTDHDTVDGLEAFVLGCRESGLAGICGIELSAKVEHPMTVHILGYRLRRLQAVRDAMDWIVDRRNARNRKMCARLRELGMEIDVEDVEREAGGRVVARPHFATAMIRKGYVSDRASAFSKYLAKGGLAYVPRESYSPSECISLIKDADGLPVLAHPDTTRLEGEEMDELLAELKGLGLWGMECISSHFSAEKSLEYLTTASRHGLYATAGSDFHGGNRPHVAMGVQVREDFLPWARLGVRI